MRMELGSNKAVKEAIMGGLGISALCRHTLTFEVATGELVILNVEGLWKGFPVRRSRHVVCPSGKQLPIIARTFRDYLLNEGRAIVDNGYANPEQGKRP